jgi:3-oxoacyl-[acyl-carrier-protein] synthase III
VGWGKGLPAVVVTNEDLAQRMDTSDDWIRSRTGIAERRIADGRETTASLAIAAAQQALQCADADPRQLDLIIVATATPDYPLASTACLVQDALGATDAGAFDLGAGCSGFVYALVMGHRAIASGEDDLVLVIGADTLSRMVDWQDRSTCVLFGDGAGAVLLKASEGPAGVRSTLLGSDGSGSSMLYVPAGGSARPASEETVAAREHGLRMDGRGVYRFATQTMADACELVAERAGVPVADVQHFVPHQANQRIIAQAAKRLGVDESRFVSNLERYGNTSAASVPIALCEAAEKGLFHPGEHVLMVGFGAGLTWAAALLDWGEAEPGAAVPWWHSMGRRVLYGWAHMRSRGRRTWRALAEWAWKILRRMTGKGD